MLTVQGTAQKVFAFRPPGRLSSVNLWGCTQLGMKPNSFFFLQLRPGFLDFGYLTFQTTPASHSFYRNQYMPSIYQKPCLSSKPYGRSLILILLNKSLNHREAKWVDVTLYHFLGDSKLWFCVFWSGCANQTFITRINTPEEQFRGEKIWFTVSEVLSHSCSDWIFRITMRQNIMADRV